jgi:ArsR family transcriptional regulator
MIEACAIAKALSDETRLRILRVLAKTGERLCVCELEAALGKPQYAISRALGILKNAGLVDEERDGRLIRYGPRAGGDFARKAIEAVAAIPCASSPALSSDIEAARKVIAARVDGKPFAWCGCKEDAAKLAALPFA